jgi:bifunctional lysine-specific demethylase and histidyl-hydroxylase NO66
LGSVSSIGVDTRPVTLDWILDPIEPTVFFEQHWEAAPLLVSRDESDYFAALPGLDAVDELIAATVSNRLRPNGSDRLVRSELGGTLSQRTVQVSGNSVPDVQSVYRAYDDGFTVVVNQVHRRSAAVGRLCRGLQATLHHPVGANFYLTPAGAQGFLPHVDTHDVFIVQLHGEKEWHVGSPSAELPLARKRHGRQALPGAQTYTLTPGDTFYLPRGFPHEAVAGNSSSLHLTVGIHAYRWSDLIEDALELLADEDVAFRGALPPRFLDEPLDSERAAELTRRLATALSDGVLAEQAKERIGSKLVRGDAAAERGRFRALDALGGLTDDAVVARPRELLCQVRIMPDQAAIEFAGNFVTGPPLLEPALEFIARHEQFTVGELPGELSSEDRVDLVSRLVSEGLLEVMAG